MPLYRLRITIPVLLVALSTALAAHAADEALVKSPNDQVQFHLTQEAGQLKFSVTSHGKTIIEPSIMQMTLDGVDLSRGVEIGKTELTSINERYPWRGNHTEAVNHYNGIAIVMRHVADNQSYALEIRAFDDAVAFRHIIPAVPAANRPRVPDEGTTFVVPAESTVWHQDLEGHYEGTHTKSPVAEIKAGEWVAPPMTFKLPGGAGYASITEAALVNYAGMALEADGKRGFTVRLGHSHPISHPYRLRYRPEDIERVSKPAEVTGTITTPWRVVLLGTDLNTLVNSDVIPDLNPPADKALFPQGIHTDWVRTGRAVWDYLDRPPQAGAPATPASATQADAPAAAPPAAPDAQPPAQGQGQAPRQGGGGGFRRSPEESLKNMKDFIDKAQELGFEHNIMEGFWVLWTDDQIRELVKYGNDRQVAVWFWRSARGRSAQFGQGRGGANQGARNSVAPNPAGPNQPAQNPSGPNPNPAFRGFADAPQGKYSSGSLFDAQVRHDFLTHLHELGVSGIKIDFFDHEAKEVIDLYEAILKEGAENHLLVDFHGANKPTGQSRTWPNEMVREAVRGMEASRLADRATHGVNLPFTRLLAGPAEYTPVIFGERRSNTTWAHQVASAAILSAPVLTYSASPTTILANPACDMIKSIPAIWDQTIVLPPSEIGDVAVFARRTGNTWFLAVMNNPDAKLLQVPLSFLGAGKYDTLLVRDSGDDPTSMKVETSTSGQGDTMKIDVRPGGGFIARFTKAAN